MLGENIKLLMKENGYTQMAECNLNVSAVIRKLELARNTVIYHCDKIYEKTNLDPRNFYDLIKLLKKAGVSL